jgi:hypothetical protein
MKRPNRFFPGCRKAPGAKKNGLGDGKELDDFRFYRKRYKGVPIDDGCASAGAKKAESDHQQYEFSHNPDRRSQWTGRTGSRAARAALKREIPR